MIKTTKKILLCNTNPIHIKNAVYAINEYGYVADFAFQLIAQIKRFQKINIRL